MGLSNSKSNSTGGFFGNNNSASSQVVSNSPLTVKGLLLGHYAGQSTLLSTYIKGQYSPPNSITIGSEFAIKIFPNKDKFQIWDVNTCKGWMFKKETRTLIFENTAVVIICVNKRGFSDAKEVVEKIIEDPLLFKMPIMLVETTFDEVKENLINPYNAGIVELKEKLIASDVDFKGHFRVSALKNESDSSVVPNQLKVEEIFEKAFDFGKEFIENSVNTKEEASQIQNN